MCTNACFASFLPCRPAVITSYLVSATAALLSALCYTEMAVSLPITGGGALPGGRIYEEMQTV